MSENQTSGKVKKYEFVSGDYIEITDAHHRLHRLHRIRALIDFDDVKVGDYGGYIETEDNLSHEGNCWVYSDAVRISKNAMVWGYAHVYGNAKLYNSAEVCDFAIICDNVKIYEDAKVHQKAKVSGNSYIHGIAEIGGFSDIVGDVLNIYGNTIIKSTVSISGSANISGETVILGNTTIKGDDIYITGQVLMLGHTNIRGGAYITSNDDFISITNIGPHRDILTAYVTKDSQIRINTCCFDGSLEEFDQYVRENWSDTLVGYEYSLFSKSIEERIKNSRKTEEE